MFFPRKSSLSEDDRIYTMGVFLMPRKCLIDGEEKWRWVVDEFDGDSFMLGDWVGPVECVPTLEGLLPPDPSDESIPNEE